MKDNGERQKYLEKNCHEIFQAELFEWYTDENIFPKDLKRREFDEYCISGESECREERYL